MHHQKRVEPVPHRASLHEVDQLARPPSGHQVGEPAAQVALPAHQHQSSVGGDARLAHDVARVITEQRKVKGGAVKLAHDRSESTVEAIDWARVILENQLELVMADFGQRPPDLDVTERHAGGSGARCGTFATREPGEVGRLRELAPRLGYDGPAALRKPNAGGGTQRLLERGQIVGLAIDIDDARPERLDARRVSPWSRPRPTR